MGQINHRETLALEMIRDLGKLAMLKSEVIKKILDTDDIELLECVSCLTELYRTHSPERVDEEKR